MLEIGMALRLKGMTSIDTIAGLTGLDHDDVEAVVAKMVQARHASETPRGFRLTPEGKGWLDGLLADERALLDAEAIDAIYERFSEHNAELKQLVADWQLREVEGEQVINDHTDADYDASIIARLHEIDAAIAPSFADAAARAPRLGRYIERLAAALAAIDSGDHSMLASPLEDSYHTVWFEMHEELILLAGRTRADEAAAGRS